MRNPAGFHSRDLPRSECCQPWLVVPESPPPRDRSVEAAPAITRQKRDCPTPSTLPADAGVEGPTRPALALIAVSSSAVAVRRPTLPGVVISPQSKDCATEAVRRSEAYGAGPHRVLEVQLAGRW